MAMTSIGVNPFAFDDSLAQRLLQAPVPPLTARPVHDRQGKNLENVQLLPDLLNSQELDDINRVLEGQSWLPVGQNGILSDYRPGNTVGSWRASAYHPLLASALWRRIRGTLSEVRDFSLGETDWDNHALWRAIGVNPLLRFIRYDSGGLLVPHYDAPYIVDDQQRTLVTVILYLHQEGSGGATRFILDPHKYMPLGDHNYSDWTRLAHSDEIAATLPSLPGSALLFDHRVLHDSEPVQEVQDKDLDRAQESGGACKIVLRTDIMYLKEQA
jgi:hypothetical protein